MGNGMHIKMNDVKPDHLYQVVKLSEILLANLELEELLHQFANALKEFFNVTEVYIVLYDKERDMLVPAAASDPLHETYRQLEQDVTRDTPSITRHVMQTGRPENVPDVEACPYIARPIANMFPTHSMLAVPLLGDSGPLGAILLGESRTYRSFSLEEVTHASRLARYVSLAVHHAQIHQEIRERARDLEVLHALAQDVMTLHNSREITRRVLQALEARFPQEYITIYRVNPYTNQPEVLEVGGRARDYAETLLQMGWSEELERGILAATLRAGRPQYVEDVSADPRYIPLYAGVRSEFTVPLIVRGEITGLINIESPVQARFDARTRHWVETLAATYGAALENAYLYADLERLIAERHEALVEITKREKRKDEFIENLTHEMKNALTFVRGYVEILADDLKDVLDEDQKRAMEIIEQRVNDMSSLVTDVLLLQRDALGQFEAEPVDIARLVENCVLSAMPSAEEKHLHLHYEPPASTPGFVFGNARRLQQVLDNLLSNAIKFTPPGRNITVTLQKEEDRVVIAVADEGIGIPEEELDLVFERFYQTEEGRKRRGAGVGLAISKRIVEAHQGHIWVESEVGKGSTFYVELPLMAAEPSAEE